MLGIRFAPVACALSLGCVLGCSSSSAPDSQVHGAGGNPGGGLNVGNAGSAPINTDPGSTAMPDTPDCGSVLDVIYRDFAESKSTDPAKPAHPDFEMTFQGDVVRRGLVESTLGTDSKPIFKDRIGHPPLMGSPIAINTDWQPKDPVIASADSFKQWYTTTSGVNQAFPKKLPLSEIEPGIFGYESNTFFPLGPTEGFGVTPVNGNPQGANFLFTTEVHVQFKYTGAQKFTFRGDDDLWIFVNGQLALDLGSMHSVEEGTIDFDAQAAALNIAIGGTYPMDIFHAERHTFASNFKITTNISCFTPGVVK
jgi:fibro-slime domain-containing protein